MQNHETQKIVIMEATGESSSRSKVAFASVRVAVRVRPLLHAEKVQNGRSIVKVLDKKLVILMDPGVTASDDFLRINKSREQRFAFDLAFDEFADQQTVADISTEGIIDGICRGVNACVFTYGATGAGKTFTMLGSDCEPGLMSITLRELFSKLNVLKGEKEIKVKCSFVEVYNENIRDLLGEGKDLDLREDPVKGMCVAGVNEIGNIEKVEDIMDLLQRGNRNRSTEPTAANVTSSRSHAVLQVVVEVSERGQGATTCIQIGKLSLIDLAGSERASVTNNKGIRLLEGANINRSLLALGNCITALADNANGGKGVFVPYRDSKLTRLLKDSLGGNCRTVMIANVSPSHVNYEDTRNTLKYANRAKNIQTDISVNRTTVTQHISNYNEIITELKSVVYDLKGKLSAVERSSESVRVASEQWRQELMDNLDERVRLKKSLIDIKREIGILSVERVAMQGFTPRPKTPVPGEEEDAEDDVIGDPKSLTDKINNLRTRKGQIDARIEENERVMVQMQAELPARVRDEDVCAFLLLLYRNQVLEIEAMDRNDQLEWVNNKNDELVRKKDREIDLLKEQIRLRDEVIAFAKEKLPDSLLITDDFMLISNRLIDADQVRIQSAGAEIPSSPLPGLSLTSLMNSPKSVIPLSNRIKGIAETILQSSVKTSPRNNRLLDNENAAPPSTAESCHTPKKKTGRKVAQPNTTRPVPSLPPLSIQGTTSPYQTCASTRRSRTENPPNSKQGKRLKQVRTVLKSNLKK